MAQTTKKGFIKEIIGKIQTNESNQHCSTTQAVVYQITSKENFGRYTYTRNWTFHKSNTHPTTKETRDNNQTSVQERKRLTIVLLHARKIAIDVRNQTQTKNINKSIK